MNLDRRFVARAYEPLKKDPPKVCSDGKTITLDTFKTHLFLFPDKRPEAIAYVKEVLPTLLPLPVTPEQGLKWYQNLEANQFLEFDFTTNQLFLCALKKT
jgi:hypothetical protein